jgi:hypothetical protein
MLIGAVPFAGKLPPAGIPVSQGCPSWVTTVDE